MKPGRVEFEGDCFGAVPYCARVETATTGASHIFDHLEILLSPSDIAELFA